MSRGSLLRWAIGGLALSGCALIDLRPFSIESCPASPNQILAAATSVWVQFPEPVMESEVERLFSVSAGGEPVAGDLRWEANRLIFTPLSPFAPGRLHSLALEGTVRTVAGRSFAESISIPFFVGTDTAAPILTRVEPTDGSVVGATDAVLLAFSQPIDEGSFRDALSVSPSTELSVSWSGSFTVAKVAPAGRWSPQRLHTWRLSTQCRSQGGIALGRAWTGSFLVQGDGIAPQVLSTAPAEVSGAVVTPLPAGLSTLRYEEAILITFSKEIDLASLVEAFSLSPPHPGTMRRISPTLFAYVTASGWLMGQEYLLTISRALTDLSGNPLPAPYRELFTPAIPEQLVAEITLSGDLASSAGSLLLPTALLNSPAPLLLAWVMRSMKPDSELELAATLRFACAYDAAYRSALVDGIELAGYFPPDLPDPEVTQVGWLDSRTLRISYLGFRRSTIDPANGTGALYYRLTVPSGPELTANQEGSFLARPVTLLLESGSD